MLILHIHLHVKPEHVPAFTAASLENARNSVREPGIARFDVLQHSDDPTRFTFVEVFRSVAATAAHRETPHYLTWVETVADMMVAPRTRQQFVNLFPDDTGW